MQSCSSAWPCLDPPKGLPVQLSFSQHCPKPAQSGWLRGSRVKHPHPHHHRFEQGKNNIRLHTRSWKQSCCTSAAGHIAFSSTHPPTNVIPWPAPLLLYQGKFKKKKNWESMANIVLFLFFPSTRVAWFREQLCLLVGLPCPGLAEVWKTPPCHPLWGLETEPHTQAEGDGGVPQHDSDRGPAALCWEQ